MIVYRDAGDLRPGDLVVVSETDHQFLKVEVGPQHHEVDGWYWCRIQGSALSASDTGQVLRVDFRSWSDKVPVYVGAVVL